MAKLKLPEAPEGYEVVTGVFMSCSKCGTYNDGHPMFWRVLSLEEAKKHHETEILCKECVDKK